MTHFAERLIDKLMENDLIGAKHDFNRAISEKILAKLESKKIELAKRMVTNESVKFSGKTFKEDHNDDMGESIKEAKTNIYHKYMLKALGKSRLPKNHSYTSTIINGDFVVHDRFGNIAGRIPKGEHDLKEVYSDKN